MSFVHPQLTPRQVIMLNDLAHGALAVNVGHKIDGFMMKAGERRMSHTGNALSYDEFVDLLGKVPYLKTLPRAGGIALTDRAWRVAAEDRPRCLDLVQELVALPQGFSVEYVAHPDADAGVTSGVRVERCAA